MTQKIPKVVLLIESSRAAGRNLLCGVANYAHDHGPWSFYWEPGGLESARPRLKAADADGIMLRDTDQLDEIFALGIPAVVIGHRGKEVPGLVNVVTDSATVGRIAAEHLLECGFKHFAYVGFGREPAAPVWSRQREKFFCHRIGEAGFDTATYALPARAAVDWTRERPALAGWLKSLPKPVGLMACNDDCGVQAMEACKLADLAVPELVGVIGADNDEILCGLANPAMSSVAINFERAGYEAARALDQLMRGGRRTSLRINVPATHIVTRRSTDIVAIDDAPLSRALRFIRDHAAAPLAVGAVARAAGLSRRALERRFRSVVGSSILEQIRRARTDRISRLLVETNLPINEIAGTLGFEDPQHFARYFRAAKQMSPLAYRKLYGQPARRTAPQSGGSFAQTGVVPAWHRVGELARII